MLFAKTGPLTRVFRPKGKGSSKGLPEPWMGCPALGTAEVDVSFICRRYRRRRWCCRPLRFLHPMMSRRFRSIHRHYLYRGRNCCHGPSPDHSGRTGAWCSCDPGQCCRRGRNDERRITIHCRRCVHRRRQRGRPPRRDRVQMPSTNDSASLLHL